MFDIMIPPKAGFKQRRGRPVKKESLGGTPELQQKHRRIRDIIADKGSPVILSWLHVAYHDSTISQELFELGEDYLRLRIQVLRHQERRRLRISHSTLIPQRGQSLSPAREHGDAKAEETWRCLAHAMPRQILNHLDDLLLENINYDLTSEQITINKLRLKQYLIILDRYKDIYSS